MTRKVLLDTGPLVALVNRRDRYHTWAREQVAELAAPLFTCEAVLTEACHLLRNLNGGIEAVMEMAKRELLAIPFCLEEEAERIVMLIRRYSDVPMSLADACLVRMAEQHVRSAIMTLDSDFHVYRRNGRQVIPTLMPGTS
jgi:predicted nucleic acid-binding protein